MDLSDKVVLITGGGTGIGRETAILFSKEGSRVFIWSRREKILKKLADKYKNISYLVGDVSKKTLLKEIVEKDIVSSHGKIDILVNDAGTFEHNFKVTDTSEDQWSYIMDNNLKSVYLMSNAVLPHMINQGMGAIINISSIIASISAPNSSAYMASKGAVIALTKSMAKDYAQYGIRVNCVSPSLIDTDMTKDIPLDIKEKIIEQHLIKRIGQPKDVAEAILYLAKAEWTTGLDLPVDGGVNLR